MKVLIAALLCFGAISPAYALCLDEVPEYSVEELYEHALTLVNAEREKHGMDPVRLSDVRSAQAHADDMLDVGYYSHWYSDNVKPYVDYTRQGGTGYAMENVATWGGCQLDPAYVISHHTWSMVYDDAHADWGHRDNILYPDHTHVNFGIAYDADDVYFVQHFENNSAQWVASVEDGRLYLEGNVLPYDEMKMAVIRDPDAAPLLPIQLNGLKPWNLDYYEYGDTVGYIAEQLWSDHYYNYSKAPLSWYRINLIEDGRISIMADVERWIDADGIHSVLIWYGNEDADGSIEYDYLGSILTLDYLESK